MGACNCLSFTTCKLPPLRGMENPEEFEIDEDSPEISEEEYQKSKYRRYVSFIC